MVFVYLFNRVLLSHFWLLQGLTRNHVLKTSEAELLQNCEQNLFEQHEDFLDKNCRSVVVSFGLFWYSL